jgi:hypothetical protein
MENKIERPSWDELNTFRYNIFPHNLAITTNVDEDELKKLWEEFIKIEDPQDNFDGFVEKRTGKFAMSSCFESTEFTM